MKKQYLGMIVALVFSSFQIIGCGVPACSIDEYKDTPQCDPHKALSLKISCDNGHIDPKQTIPLLIQNNYPDFFHQGVDSGITSDASVKVSLLWQDGRPPTQVVDADFTVERNKPASVNLKLNQTLDLPDGAALKVGGPVIFQVKINNYWFVQSSVCTLDPLT